MEISRDSLAAVELELKQTHISVPQLTSLRLPVSRILRQYGGVHQILGSPHINLDKANSCQAV